MRPSPKDVVIAFTESALLVELYGEDFIINVFEVMESECDALSRRKDAVDRAMRVRSTVREVGLDPSALMARISSATPP